MSEVMLAVLELPDYLFWADDPMSRHQHNQVRKEAAKEIRESRARIAELEADAARYRWLREECKNPIGGLTIASVTEWGLEGWSGDDPDNRIDEAMGEEEGKQ